MQRNIIPIYNKNHHQAVSYTHLAFNIFVRQSLREGGIPFEVKLEQPNKETIAAMLEAERIAKDPSEKGYNDLDELFACLLYTSRCV